MTETDKKQLLFATDSNNIGSSLHLPLLNQRRNLEPDKCGANVTSITTSHLQTGELYHC